MRYPYKTLVLLLLIANLVLCASSQKKLEQAREKDPQYQYNLGLFHLNNNNLDEAIRYLNKSISLNPRYFLSFNALGMVYSMKGNLPESANAFQRCLQINAGFTEARNNLGMVFQERGFLDRAEEEFKKAIEDLNYSTRELPYYNLARLYFQQQKHEQALSFIQDALKIEGRLAMAHNLKGLILESLDRVPEAIVSYTQALKIVPNEVNFKYNLAVALFKNNEFQQSAELFEQISPQVADPDMRDKISQYLKVIKKEDTSASFRFL